MNRDFHIDLEGALMTVELLTAINDEIKILETEQGLETISDLVFHDMGYSTNGKWKFIMSGCETQDGEEILVVTSYDDGDEITDQPNA